MKLIKQANLHFQDEKSDKVYEVGLFHIQAEEYIVNFRYGRRGKRLTEGTKTVFPVNRAAADKIFNELVASKTKKGYQETAAVSSSVPPPSPVPGDAQGAIVTVTKYIKQLATGQKPNTNWKASRIIWRAGELKIEEVADEIGQMLPQLRDHDRYSAIWYLGRIADRKSLGILQSLNISLEERAAKIYKAAMLKCNDVATINEMVAILPTNLRTMYEANDVQGYFQQLNHYLFQVEAKQIDFLLSTYYLSLVKEDFKKPMLLTLSMLPLKPNYWKYIRYIYKIAEMADDGKVMAILAQRIQKNPAFYNKNYWGDSVYFNNKRYNVSEELKKPNAELAFSGKTKKYFIARTIRRLRQAGQDRQEIYCAIATEILNQYGEEDRMVHDPSSTYRYDSATKKYVVTKQYYSDLAHIPYLYYILYSSGNRFNISRINKFYFDGEPTKQTQREDAFPSLWDQYPKYAVEVLTQARLREVATFAMNVLEGRSDLMSLFAIADLKKMIRSPFVETQKFSLNIVRQKYDASNPEIALIIALIDSQNAEAIDLALELINQNPIPFKNNDEFVKHAIISDHGDLHAWMRTNISEEAFEKEQKQSILNYALAYYKKLEEGSVAENSVDSLIACFKGFLSNLGTPFILSLLEDEQLQMQLFAGKLVNANNVSTAELPDNIIIRLLESQHASIRAQGIGLLTKLTDDELSKKEKLIVGLVVSPLEDLREKGRDLVGRLAKIDLEFRDRVFLELYPQLLEDHEDESVPVDVWETISAHLLASVPLIMPNIENVLKDHHRETHLLAEHLLNGNTNLSEWTVEQIALMGDHDMKSIREMSHQYYLFNIDRMIYYKEDALKILNTEWEDTLEFAYEFFDNHFTEKEWSPDLIISLCDNVRPEVQVFGTRLLGEFFKEEHGVKYLSELSEHPDPVIQLYTTNYLDRYAFNNEKILAKLEPYFRTILNAINAKRAAKLRVIQFLSKQAMEGEEYGKYVSDILQDVIGTIAVSDKERYILMLKQIENKYDHFPKKIETVPLEVRSK